MKFNGKKLKELRLIKGYKQLDIAKLTKELGTLVDSRTISNWENSPTANPRHENLQVVAEVLGVSTSVFYTDDLESKTNSVTPAITCEILPPYIEFWKTIGYRPNFDENNNIVLSTSKRNKDIVISINDMENLYDNVKNYCEFLLHQITTNIK